MEVGVGNSGISEVAREKARHAAGFIWRFEFEGEKLSPEILSKYKNPKSARRAVSQYDRQGNFIRSYESIMEAKRQTGADEVSIRKVCSGKNKLALGFIWRYGVDSSPLDEEILAKHNKLQSYYREKAVIQYTLEGEVVNIHRNIRQAAEKGNISY